MSLATESVADGLMDRVLAEDAAPATVGHSVNNNNRKRADRFLGFISSGV